MLHELHAMTITGKTSTNKCVWTFPPSHSKQQAQQLATVHLGSLAPF